MPFHICGEEIAALVAVVSPLLPFVAAWYNRLKKGKHHG